MQKQDFFKKQQNKGNFSSGVIRNPKHKSKTHFRLILVFLLIIGGIIFFYGKNIINTDVTTQVTNNAYPIGNQIQKEGTISSDGDLMNYTHSLITPEGEKFLLKSKTIPLNNYSNNLSGMFQIAGTIVSYYNNNPLIEVSTIGTQTTSENPNTGANTENEDNKISGIYLSKAGLGFPSSFFDEYAFIGEAGNNGEIRIKNLDNEKVTTIKFFNCTDSGDTNCKQLTKTFDNTAAKKITTINGDTFFKLPEVNSWYFENNGRWGYFINDAEEEEVKKIENWIMIPNAEMIKNIITRYGVKTCLGKDQGTNTITSHTIQKTNEGLKITMEGTGEKAFSCETLLDIGTSKQLKFLDIKVKEPLKEDINESTPQKEESGIKEENKPDVKDTMQDAKKDQQKDKENAVENNTEELQPSKKQFPINLEKTMKYNSSRGGYTMSFPSYNIAYSSSAVDKSFGDNIHCNYATKVIQYSKKDEIENAPSLIAYECKLEEESTINKNNYLIKKVADKNFVIEILDPSWFDFGKNIEITGIENN